MNNAEELTSIKYNEIDINEMALNNIFEFVYEISIFINYWLWNSITLVYSSLSMLYEDIRKLL